jgi:hypothetical protein
MRTVRSLRSTMVLGCMAVCFIFVIGCTSTRAVIEPPVETVTPPPVVDPAPSPPLGPPPGYVKPENYWVREKIILVVYHDGFDGQVFLLYSRLKTGGLHGQEVLCDVNG